MKHYIGNIEAEANTIFVFGSNPEVRHGAGAAKVAREKFGAIYGQGEELIKKAYADSELSGREYERVVKYVESILNDKKLKQ